MIAEYRDNRQAHRFLQCPDQPFGLLNAAVIGQVATQDRDVRAGGGRRQHRCVAVRGVAAEMQIGERDQPDGLSGAVSSRVCGQLHLPLRKK